MNPLEERRHKSRRAEDRRDALIQQVLVVCMVLISLSAVLGVALLYWSTYTYGRGRFHFDAKTYIPIEDKLCPGDVLTIQVTLSIDRAPLLLEFSDSWWSIAEGYTVRFGQPREAIYTDATRIVRPWFATVPDLPAGEYEYRLAAHERLSPTRAFAVPFTVLECERSETP